MSWVLDAVLDGVVRARWNYSTEALCTIKRDSISSAFLETDSGYTFSIYRINILDDTVESASNTYSSSKISEVAAQAAADHVKTFGVPASANVVAGTGMGIPVVSDMQVAFDGNVYHIQEVAATPGFDIRVTFTGITSVKGLAALFYYSGGVAGHQVSLDLYNQNTKAWDSYILISNALTYSYRYIEFPNGDQYISGGTVEARFYHTSSGNASHDIYIDFIGLAY